MKSSLITFILLVTCFFGQSCSRFANQTQNKSTLACIHIVDRNGMTETISAEEKLSKLNNVDFEKKQPYKQVTQIIIDPNCQKDITSLDI